MLCTWGLYQRDPARHVDKTLEAAVNIWAHEVSGKVAKQRDVSSCFCSDSCFQFGTAAELKRKWKLFWRKCKSKYMSLSLS